MTHKVVSLSFFFLIHSRVSAQSNSKEDRLESNENDEIHSPQGLPKKVKYRTKKGQIAR